MVLRLRQHNIGYTADGFTVIRLILLLFLLDCNNYRGISLLCHCYKVFTAILMKRLTQRTDEILSEEQAGFRPGRGTIDQIFILRQIAEKYEEFGKDLYVCYIDFRKAFDSAGEMVCGLP